jgi:prepilin-type processing-associated H-X9-DG protein
MKTSPNVRQNQMTLPNSAGAADEYDTLENRHFDGVNVAFVDGHVKWMKKERAATG